VLGFILPTDPAAWGAFLTGFASVLAVCLSLRHTKAKADDNCDKRVQEIKKAFMAGTEFEHRQQERRQSSG